MSRLVCYVCGNEVDNKSHCVREMMHGSCDQFAYLECSACGCLQLMSRPSDLRKYYPSDYYSFSNHQPGGGVPGAKLIRRFKNRLCFSDSALLRGAVDRFSPSRSLVSVASARPGHDARILDVGCGAGDLLRDLACLGFKNLLGIDAFLEADRPGPPPVRRARLEDLQGSVWDLIMFHHSFEHVPDPRSTLALTSELLRSGGLCLIRTPVIGAAWQTYGVNWVELDAPRHFHVFSQRGLTLLAEGVGLTLANVRFDTSEFEFWGSELYKRGIVLNTAERHGLSNYFSARDMKRFRAQARVLNAEGRAGRAALLFRKK